MIKYFDNIEELIEIHKKTIEFSGGGTYGILNSQYLESAIEHIRNDDYYPEFEDKLTHLFWSLNKNHIFQDGNKRIALTISTMFLLKNGYMIIAGRFMQEMEAISYHVAAGHIDKKLLGKLISSFLYDDDFSEELKLELLNAFSKG
ncbi:MAG: type II toxin-antitoxin system death-on-curing family toxin [Candidatus Kapabacteria bacterium]|nr:type II toxin-antitoxin system death-on-curing family toxin [Candidatus Kapabacteria bacterium]